MIRWSLTTSQRRRVNEPNPEEGERDWISGAAVVLGLLLLLRPMPAVPPPASPRVESDSLPIAVASPTAHAPDDDASGWRRGSGEDLPAPPDGSPSGRESKRGVEELGREAFFVVRLGDAKCGLRSRVQTFGGYGREIAKLVAEQDGYSIGCNLGQACVEKLAHWFVSAGDGGENPTTYLPDFMSGIGTAEEFYPSLMRQSALLVVRGSDDPKAKLEALEYLLQREVEGEVLQYLVAALQRIDWEASLDDYSDRVLELSSIFYDSVHYGPEVKIHAAHWAACSGKHDESVGLLWEAHEYFDERCYRSPGGEGINWCRQLTSVRSLLVDLSRSEIPEFGWRQQVQGELEKCVDEQSTSGTGYMEIAMFRGTEFWDTNPGSLEAHCMAARIQGLVPDSVAEIIVVVSDG